MNELQKKEVEIVRKNVTIPAWLDTFAEKQSINFSRVLQEALLTMATKVKK